MSKAKTKIYELVELVRQHGPISPNQLTELTGDFRQSIDRYVREAHDAGLIYVASLGPSPFGGNRTVKMYAIGKGIDAQRASAERKAKASTKQSDSISRKGMKFSPYEKRVIREIKLSGRSVKSQMHRLPGRTFYGVQRAVCDLKGKKTRGVGSWIWTSAVAILAREPNLTIIEISSRIGCTSRQVANLMNENHGQRVFISGWGRSGYSFTSQWSLGKEADVPRPPKQTEDERRRRARMRHQQRKARLHGNPFAAALGLARVPASGLTGRVYQPMDIRDDQEMAA